VNISYLDSIYISSSSLISPACTYYVSSISHNSSSSFISPACTYYVSSISHNSSSSFISHLSCLYLLRVFHQSQLIILLYLPSLLPLEPPHAPHICTGQLVFSSDETAGYSSLYHLLWCAVTDDFEVRSKAVALLVG
jgi:hypothetical protein